MPENESQGISRRDLLKRGAALGGAVVWATPVVQTLGMGRAFAANGTPVEDGKDISYIAITWRCPAGDEEAQWFFAKNNANGSFGTWEAEPGAIPKCEGQLLGHEESQKVDGSTHFSVEYDGNCAEVIVSGSLEGCEIHYVLMGGTKCCAGTLSVGTQTVCLDCP